MNSISDKLVSINIINKNSFPYSQNIVKSLPILTNHLNTEVIVIDDYSTDRSAEILKKVSDEFVQKETNRGEARAYGDKIVDGDIIVEQLDADQRILDAERTVIEWYLENMPDFALKVGVGFITQPEWIREIGWGNYQFAEDRYAWDRFIDNDMMKFVNIRTADHPDGHQNSSGGKNYSSHAIYSYPDAFLEERDLNIEREIIKMHNGDKLVKHEPTACNIGEPNVKE